MRYVKNSPIKIHDFLILTSIVTLKHEFISRSFQSVPKRKISVNESTNIHVFFFVFLNVS